MATGTFVLRPSADVSVQHTLIPTSSTAAYLLINEEVCDEDATYIKCETGGTDSSVVVTKFSEFSLSGSLPTDKFKITSVRIVMVYKAELSGSAYNTFTFVFGGTEIAADTTTLQQNTITDESGTTVLVWKENVETYDNNSEIISYLNSWIATSNTLPNLRIGSEVHAQGTSKSSGRSTVDISQVCVEIDYTTDFGLNIHRKVGGQWLQAQAAYQKQGGVWVEITEDECKSILANSLVTKG